jgi:hypothetical protein
MNNEQQFEIGDWIKGNTREGALVQGYIVGINSSHGVIKMHVVDSDNEKMVGRTIRMLHTWAKKLSISSAAREEQIFQLIDIALLTKDEKWFMELSAGLNFLKEGAQATKRIDTFYPSRLNNSETRESKR